MASCTQHHRTPPHSQSADPAYPASSASASLPLIYFTSKNKPSPMTAPNFCMLLRKHIGSARVSDIRQPGMERVVMFELEHLNELWDPCKKVLIMELMGKHFQYAYAAAYRN